jgi:hypothetical protein
MSVAFYIVLDHQNLNFDTFVNGKAIAHCDALETILKKLELKDIYDYVDGDMDDFFDNDMEEDDDFEEEQAFDPSKYKWFTAAEGIEYFSKIKTYLQDNAAEVDDAEYVIADLDEYIVLLHKAGAIGANWHLQIDM